MQTNSSFPSNDTTSAVQRGVDSAEAAMHSGIDKVADPARQAVERLSTVAHGTVDKLANSATETVNQFSDQTRRVTEAPARALACSKSWVQDRPLEAVGAALALGFLVGRLTGR